MPVDTTVPLGQWAPIHPAAVAMARGEMELPSGGVGPLPRSTTLAERLAQANRGWGNPVDDAIDRWLGGATAVVTGQQPGLLGGPLLTLVKACAVAARVRREHERGKQAVGFLWLATADDDLPEMSWGAVAMGEELLRVQEKSWVRGELVGGAATLGNPCASLLQRLAETLPSGHAREAVSLASDCYRPGAALGTATARFLARLLAGEQVIIVDSRERELARAAAPVVQLVLEALPQAYDVLSDGASGMKERGWVPPLRAGRGRLPVFRASGEHRERLASARGACPRGVLAEHQGDPSRFTPNVWLRPLVQDAALGSSVTVLGGAELAYHVQVAGLWELAGVRRPAWSLRPHATVVTAAERRLVRQLRLAPEHMLRRQLPSHLLGGRRVRRELARLRSSLEKRMAELQQAAHEELPAVKGDAAATHEKLSTAIAWLEGRSELAATRTAEVEAGRWQRLRVFLRPRGRPQERELSVLAPLLKLGLEWPSLLTRVLEGEEPGMHLLHWHEGGAW